MIRPRLAPNTWLIRGAMGSISKTSFSHTVAETMPSKLGSRCAILRYPSRDVMTVIWPPIWHTVFRAETDLERIDWLGQEHCQLRIGSAFGNRLFDRFNDFPALKVGL